MKRRLQALAVSLLAGGLALATAGCLGGGGESEVAQTTAAARTTAASVTTAGPGTTRAGKASKRFANFRVIYNTGIDFLDPGLSYTVEGRRILWNVYLGLLGYRHVSGPAGATLVPALAEGLPRISSGGRVYELTLRKGLRYSNGEPVRASDFEYAIKRLYLLESPGVGLFSNIVGAEDFATTGKGDIRGIQANDATRKITITLTKPQGTFGNILATTFAAPVPARTPATDQSTHPIPATGPYAIQSYRPNVSFALTRNRHFAPTPTVPRGNPDRITGTIVDSDSAALQRVLEGKADYDLHPIPADRLASVRRKYGDRLKVYTVANTYYFFMNTRVPPFDKLEVRQAVNYAIDRRALASQYSGFATPTENVLPPTYPQYRRIDRYPHDLARAKRLIEAAGATGARVTVWGNDRETSQTAITYLRDVLNSIGLRASVKTSGAAVYWTTIGDQATRAQIGFANWYHDYPHPTNWFDVLLNGERITQRYNNNYSNADVPAINRKIDQLKTEPKLSAEVNAGWAQLDRMVAEDALWAPYANLRSTDFFGARVDTRCYVNHVLYEFDFSQICLE